MSKDTTKNHKNNLLKKGRIREDDLLLFAILIVLMGLVVIMGLFVNQYIKNSSGNSTRQSSANEITPPYVLSSQQKVQTKAFDVTIKDVTENDKQDRAFPISDNETMLILNISITNRTQSDQNFYPASQLYVRNKDGDYSALHASMYVTNPLQPGKIKPGESLSGQVSFNVLKRDARPLLYVDTGWDNQVPVVFDVLH